MELRRWQERRSYIESSSARYEKVEEHRRSVMVHCLAEYERVDGLHRWPRVASADTCLAARPLAPAATAAKL